MKKLPIKTYREGKQGNVNTITLLMDCLNAAPQGGFSKDDIAFRVHIQKFCLKAVEEKSTEFLFEETDAAIIKQIVEGVRWPQWHPDILDFLNDVENM